MYRNGEKVDEKTLNVPVRQLASRTDYLKRRLAQALEYGSCVVLPNVPLSDDPAYAPEAGNVVYCGNNGKFMKASARMSRYDDFEAADSALTVGILVSSTGTTGNVLVYGKMGIGPSTGFTADKLLAQGEEFRSGRYYLSAIDDGKLTAHPTGPLVYVCSLQSAGGSSPTVAYVNPQFLDIGTSHVHRVYQLVARPAGDVVDGKVEGFLPDAAGSTLSPAAPGSLPKLKFHGQWTRTDKITYKFWLAGNGDWGGTVFHWSYTVSSHVTENSKTLHSGADARNIDVGNGLLVDLVLPEADSSSVYGDIQDGQLNWTGYEFPDVGRGWESCTEEDQELHPGAKYKYVMSLHEEVDRYFPPVPAQSAGLFVNGVAMESSGVFHENPTYEVGHDTIYWMTDERLPWPDAATSRMSVVDHSEDKTIAFYFNVGFQCANGPVTSISPAPGSPIKTYTYGTRDPAYTGDLSIDLDFDLEVVEGGVPGYQVAKKGQGGKLLAGPVVEKIKAGPGLVVVPDAGCPDGQGVLTIGMDNGTLRGQFSEIALENAKQEKLGLFPYVSLLGWTQGGTSNIPSAFTATMRVPTSMTGEAYRLHVRAVVFGATGYEGARRRAAGLKFEYNILPDYTDDTHRSLKTGLIVPDSPSSRTITLPFGHSESGVWKYVAYDPFVATTDTSEEERPDVVVPAFRGPVPNSAEFELHDFEDLKPGYLVAIRISRSDNPDTVGYDSYAGQIGFLSLEWTLEEII
mgnify:CR=1 FL=1